MSFSEETKQQKKNMKILIVVIVKIQLFILTQFLCFTQNNNYTFGCFILKLLVFSRQMLRALGFLFGCEYRHQKQFQIISINGTKTEHENVQYLGKIIEYDIRARGILDYIFR